VPADRPPVYGDPGGGLWLGVGKDELVGLNDWLLRLIRAKCPVLTSGQVTDQFGELEVLVAGDPPCDCGVPYAATVHVSAMTGKLIPGASETSEVDRYLCAVHGRTAREDIEAEVKPDGWKIITFSLTKITREEDHARP
jgi:hypothetical protein